MGEVATHRPVRSTTAVKDNRLNQDETTSLGIGRQHPIPHSTRCHAAGVAPGGLHRDVADVNKPPARYPVPGY
jgi:hypothetical protein